MNTAVESAFLNYAIIDENSLFKAYVSMCFRK